MFFLDSTGLFSLICLLIQCLLAWMATAFFAVIVPVDAPWLRHWRRGFFALGLGLTALSVRFLLAHHAVAGDSVLEEDALPVRLFYGVYLAGKCNFVWFLLVGVATLRGWKGPQRRAPVLLCTAAATVIGAWLPTIESILLVQAPWFALGCWRAASLLRDRVGDEPDPGRVVVRIVLRFWAVAWIVYGVAVVVIHPLHPDLAAPLASVLRLNSVVDLAVQVSLASGLLMLVMSDARRTAVAALYERDRLREQLRRDEKTRALSTLVGGIAHEINNPLTAMIGFGPDLGAVDPAVRERAARIVLEQAERCRKIVHRMSMLGQRPALAARTIDVGACVQQVIAECAPQAQLAGVELRTELGEHAVFGDETSFNHVLRNLVDNAIQASPRGACVLVRTVAKGHGVDLVVEDQGPGVPEDLRSRLFEPFWTTKPVGQGTGLGLAVVEALVHAHAGTVSVGDAAGGGAALTVHWPSAVTDGSTMPPDDLQRGPAPVPLATARRLLIIDDEPLVRMTIARQALADGWRIDEASSAGEALGLLLEQRVVFDAVICDLRMPGLSGVDLHDQLAARQPGLLEQFVFITGDTASAEAAAFAKRCSAPIVQKPFLPSELRAQLRRIANAS